MKRERPLPSGKRPFALRNIVTPVDPGLLEPSHHMVGADRPEQALSHKSSFQFQIQSSDQERLQHQRQLTDSA